MAVLKINKTISWDQVKNTLQNVTVDLGVDTGNGSRFNKIKDKNSFYKQYSDKIPFDSVQKAVNEFNAVVESVIDAEKIPSGGGNGGGGSGGSRASVVNTVIPVQPPQETEPSADKGFRDLANVPWAAEAIEALSRQGIINGISANEFAPDNKVTRAEFLKMVICAFELPEIYESALFSDISEDDWFYSYVEKAGKSGVVTGKPDGTFAPNENIQRQDMAVILMNVLKLSKINLQQVNSIQFRDENEINDYAKQSVYQLAFAGVISGKGDGYFAPEDSATRAEAAKIIYGLRR